MYIVRMSVKKGPQNQDFKKISTKYLFRHLFCRTKAEFSRASLQSNKFFKAFYFAVNSTTYIV